MLSVWLFGYLDNVGGAAGALSRRARSDESLTAAAKDELVQLLLEYILPWS